MNQATADPFMRSSHAPQSAPDGGLLEADEPPTAKQKLLFDFADRDYIADMPLGWIAEWPENPRASMRQDKLQELADSIVANGVQQPIVVRALTERLDDFPAARVQVIMGARRLRASQMAGLPIIPCIVRVGMEDKDALALAFMENQQREALTPIEEALGYRAMLAYYTQSEIAAKIGCTQGSISNALGLLKLPDRVQTLIAEDLLSASTARRLLRWADSPEAVEQIADVVVAEKLSSHALEGKNPPASIRAILDKAGLFSVLKDEPQPAPEPQEEPMQTDLPDAPPSAALNAFLADAPSVSTTDTGEADAPIPQSPISQAQSAASETENAGVSPTPVPAPIAVVSSASVALVPEEEEEENGSAVATPASDTPAPSALSGATQDAPQCAPDTAPTTAVGSVEAREATQPIPVLDKREERTAVVSEIVQTLDNAASPQSSAPAPAAPAPPATNAAGPPVVAMIPRQEQDWLNLHGLTAGVAIAMLREKMQEKAEAVLADASAEDFDAHTLRLGDKLWSYLTRLATRTQMEPYAVVAQLIEDAYHRQSADA